MSTRMITTVLGIAVVGVVGFFSGRASVETRAEPAPPSAPSRSHERPPRESIAERNTIVIGGESRHSRYELDSDGTLLLRPVDPARALLFDADEAVAAKAAVERFVGAFRQDQVTDAGPGMATLAGLQVRWRLEESADGQHLRVAVLPADPYGGVEDAGYFAQAIGEWCIVNGTNPETVRDTDDELLCGSAVYLSKATRKESVFEAAEAEFAARGLMLKQEEVAQDLVVEIARDADGALLWSFAWEPNGTEGWVAIRHHADPFDTKGEREMLTAILGRAYAQAVRIAHPRDG